MSQDGFLFDELTEFKKDLMREIKNVFPKETAKFIKTETGKVLKVAKDIAKRDVGTSKGTKKNWNESKSYHKGFKVGKIYNYGNDVCCRAYNKSPHAHLIENGHVNVPRGSKSSGRKKQKTSGSSFTAGKFVFKKAEMAFSNEYIKDAEEFLFNYFDTTTKG